MANNLYYVHINDISVCMLSSVNTIYFFEHVNTRLRSSRNFFPLRQ